jgi:methanogenic corrinoid protein MtbC1
LIIKENILGSHSVRNFREALLRGDKGSASEILSHAIGGSTSLDVLETFVVAALEDIGNSWEKGEAALSQIYISGRICEDLMAAYLIESGTVSQSNPRAAIAVLNDHHLLGKRIILAFLKASGVSVLDWGSCSEDQLVQRTLESRVDILLISTLMLPSALRIGSVRKRLRENGFTGKIIVGGAPFRIDPSLVAEVGADATAANAMECVRMVKHMLQELTE